MSSLHRMGMHSKWAHSSAVEHLTFNQRVVGSDPAGLTNFSQITAGSSFSGFFSDQLVLLWLWAAFFSLKRAIELSFQLFDKGHGTDGPAD
jgi:hypothetical protein